ncbi:hypothetical protein ISS08_01790 [Candidatus Pacearchaeota archaeon]|nr:hypothetical protein [Candidatus Pacearchaeota archaeon]
MSEKITIDVSKIKKSFKQTLDFLNQKKIINIFLIILLLVVLITSVDMRLQNLPLLKDSTTGQYIPLALDPYYFLRVAETMISEEGLPSYDNMRYPSAKIMFNSEIAPESIILIYRIGQIFNDDFSIQLAGVSFPVIFFALGLIVFFFLIFILTKSKSIAFLSSSFLAFIPLYLYRTLAGFSDHESIGMFAFFLALLSYSWTLDKLEKKDQNKKIIFNSIIGGLLVGLTTIFTTASWAGISKFLYMIIPLSFFIFWILKTKEGNRPHLKKYILFYFTWLASSVLLGPIFGQNINFVLNSLVLSIPNILSAFILVFIIIDFVLIKFSIKENYFEKKKKYRILFTVIFTIILGALFFSIFRGGFFNLISNLFERLLDPFGTARTSLTVAENRQPYLNEWISQMGKIFFWIFFGGLITLGIETLKVIKNNKNKLIGILLWVFMISGILFSRVSSSSLFNGDNFISKIFYLLSILTFFGYLIWVYFNQNIKISSNYLILFSWMIFMLISARGAVRLFFVIAPFACFSASFFIVKIFDYFKKSKDDLWKMILIILVIVILMGAIFSFNSFISNTNLQSKNTGPSANNQWQGAMKWARDNTPTGSIFVHWWDYGYWVQYLGQRPSIADGGHAVTYWDHLIGRYLLTTPYPETALSFMKSHNVSYLLIDPSDLGKYGAYSRIGSGQKGEDRYSYIPILISNPAKTQETSSGEVRLYEGGAPVDQDIIYQEEGGNEIFIPANKGGIAAILLESSTDTENIFKQPIGIFIYNGQQTDIPLRYLYVGEEFIDFGQGLEAGIKIIPRISSAANSQIQIDQLGSAIYLSPRTFEGLFSQLYLLNDPLKKYPTIKLGHSEQNALSRDLSLQGINPGEILYYNGNLWGPIKIWEINYPENILTNEEFLETSGEYAQLDNLIFSS